MKERRIFAGAGVGAASMLMILVLVSATVFAALSLLSAQADLRIAERAAQSLSDYYAADGKAQEKLAQIDSQLASIEKSTGEKTDYLARCEMLPSQMDWLKTVKETGTNAAGPLMLCYSVTVSDKQALSIALIPNYPAPDSKSRYRIIRWQLVNTEEWAPDENKLNVWNGN